MSLSLMVIVTAEQVASEAFDDPNFLAEILEEYGADIDGEERASLGAELAGLLKADGKALIRAIATALSEDAA